MKRDSWGSDLLDLLLPSGCVACGTWIRGVSSLVCVGCRTRLREPAWPRCARCHHPRGTGRSIEPDCLECRPWPAVLTAARYAYSLEAPADDLVHALKYEGWRELADFIARAMAKVALPHSLAGTGAKRAARPSSQGSRGVRAEAPTRRVIVPIPTTARRLQQRGYNQAELIAERLAELSDLPWHGALERRGGGRSQTSLTPAERRENVRGAFSPVGRSEQTVRGAHILLVDDVLTTGSTAGEAASTLTEMGAESVTLIAFARALPSRSRRAA